MLRTWGSRAHSAARFAVRPLAVVLLLKCLLCWCAFLLLPCPEVHCWWFQSLFRVATKAANSKDSGHGRLGCSGCPFADYIKQKSAQPSDGFSLEVFATAASHHAITCASVPILASSRNRPKSVLFALGVTKGYTSGGASCLFTLLRAPSVQPFVLPADGLSSRLSGVMPPHDAAACSNHQTVRFVGLL